MMRQAFTIELLEDCVFSASAATEGSHESLDRISGAALLGAAAARLYDRLDRRAAYMAFHSGRLRFLDGLPFANGTVGYPVPQPWHHRKTEKAHQQGQVDPKKIFNLLHGTIPSDEQRRPAQPKQLRKGYVHLDGGYSTPEHELRLKTAIAAQTGRAAEGQLFGYDALLRGQCFACAIEADADFDPGLFQQVVDALQGTALLGRSRSAEYGKVRVTLTDYPSPTPGPIDGNRLTLWLLADLAPCDHSGQPCLDPVLASIGLPEGARIDWSKTFLRSRRYSPWNAHRHGYDWERLVWSAGGVITVELSEPARPELLDRLQAGIGLYREAGLGRVWVNPPLAGHPATTIRIQKRGKNRGLDEIKGAGTSAHPLAKRPAGRVERKYRTKSQRTS